jgi:hypothetical protein
MKRSLHHSVSDVLFVRAPLFTRLVVILVFTLLLTGCVSPQTTDARSAYRREEQERIQRDRKHPSFILQEELERREEGRVR